MKKRVKKLIESIVHLSRTQMDERRDKIEEQIRYLKMWAKKNRTSKNKLKRNNYF